MQTLWNRIVQTKCACKCSSCFSSVASCTRRTTTAVFKSRINLRDRFTVLSSSFLTAATLIDSDIKAKKRRKLLGEIEDAKEELKSLDDSQKSRLAALSTESDDTNEMAWDDSQNHRLVAPPTECDDFKELALNGQRTWNDVFAWAQNEKDTRKILGFEEWKGIPLSILEGFSNAHIKRVLISNGNLRKLLDGFDHRLDFKPGYKTQKLIKRSSAKLADHFSSEIYALEIQNGLDNVSDDSVINLPLLDDIVRAHENLFEREHLPPHHSEIEQSFKPRDPKYIRNYQRRIHNTATLKASLNEIFKFCRSQGKSLQYLLKNICHLLLASDRATTIETYILLAKNLDELGEHRLVQLVLDAIDECQFRLNEEALVFFLDYYAKTQNAVGFQLLVGRIRGFGNGLGSVRMGTLGKGPSMLPGIAFDQYRFDERKMRPPPRCSRFEKFNARQAELGALKYRVARLNDGVYASLIKGALKFADGVGAMGHYIDLIKEGREPTIEMLTAILSLCYDQQDWRSCLRVLYEIQTIAGANLQTYRWILQLCHNLRDKEAYKESLADGIHRGIISPAVQYFPEDIEAMEADLLLDFAQENEELSQKWKDEEISSEPFGRLARQFGGIIDQMAETAFEFGSMRLSHGLEPTKGFFLYTKIVYHGANFSRWAARGKNRLCRISDGVLDIASTIPNPLVNTISGSHELSGRVEFPRILKANADIEESHIALHLRRKHASLWYPLLRILVDEFRKLRRLLRNLAQELGDIELLIRHGPTVGHMLHAKMLLLQPMSFDSVNWTEQTSLPLVHSWTEEKQRALPALGGLKEEADRLKETASQEKPVEDWKFPTFARTLKRASEVKRRPSGLGDILREAVHLEDNNILNI